MKVSGIQAMNRVPFGQQEILVLRHAIEIAEELISEFFKITTSDWKRYRYDIQSLRDLREEEITDLAFAQIHRYLRHPDLKLRGSEIGDYFKICLQDHVIRRALQRDAQIRMLPLSAYIVTHELIHVVRFAKFIHLFHSTESEREVEEVRVHAVTQQLLEGQKIEGLPEVLEVFKDCRAMETFSVT
jgi:hypothetical protein